MTSERSEDGSPWERRRAGGGWGPGALPSAAGPTGPARTWRLLGPEGSYDSPVPGTLGGNRRGRLYGRLDCPSALRVLPAGVYQRHRVFFADEATAVAAGYRPCARCLPEAHRRWKAARAG